MYKIIGADGVQYGPINVDQLRQWIGEGRVNAQTLVQVDGSTEWKPLSAYPELAPLMPPTTPPLSPAPMMPPTYTVDASSQVQGPAIGLIITAVLGLLGAVGSLGMNMFGFSLTRGHGPGGQWEQIMNLSAGGLGLAQAIIQIAVAVVILMGALKMMKLENYQWAMTSAILALIPCVSPCCLIGLPLGIWALVVLMRPEVKSMFQ